MQLFYQPNISEASKEVIFTKAESKHISKVLRKKEGDFLHITNGQGELFEVELTNTHPNKCMASILNSTKQPPLPYHLHIAVAPTKLNDRFEWFLEKATEIGISEITPIICARSERKIIKPERYAKKLQSAMKQSLKAHLPVLNPAISFTDLIDSLSNSDHDKFIAHCVDSEKRTFKSVIRPNSNMVILIGPEGDFSEKEIDMAERSGFISVDMGKSRLRTETAAIVACHSVAFVNE